MSSVLGAELLPLPNSGRVRESSVGVLWATRSSRPRGLMHVLWGASESPENQLLRDPVWPQNHLPWGLQALWIEGERRGSQGLRELSGITSRLGVRRPQPAPASTARSRSPAERGGRLLKQAVALFLTSHFVSEIRLLHRWYFSFLSSLLFPALLPSSPSPASTRLPPGVCPFLHFPFSKIPLLPVLRWHSPPRTASARSPQNEMGFASSTFGFMTHIDQLDRLFSHAPQEVSSGRNKNRSHEP